MFDKLANMFAAPKQEPVKIEVVNPTPGNLDPNRTQPADPKNPTTPNGTVQNSEQKTSPMAEYAELFKIDEKDKPKPPEPLFKIDPKKVAESASKLDFKQVVTPELLTKISAGGQEATTAMMEAMNAMIQTSMAHTATIVPKMIEQAVTKAQQSWESQLPTRLKDHNLKSSFQENPALSNPALKPWVDQVTSQFQLKNPNASEHEIRKSVSEYFDSAAKLLTEQTKQPAKDEAAKAESRFDFSNFLSNP